MVDSLFSPKMTPYVVNKVLTKQYVVFIFRPFLGLFTDKLQQKAMALAGYYCCKTMNKSANTVSSDFCDHNTIYSRFIPCLTSYIVLPELQKLTGQTTKTPIRGNGKGMSVAPKGTLNMWKIIAAIIKFVARAKDVDIVPPFKLPDNGVDLFTLLDVRRKDSQYCDNTDYELRSGTYCMYISIEK